MDQSLENCLCYCLETCQFYTQLDKSILQDLCVNLSEMKKNPKQLFLINVWKLLQKVKRYFPE